MTVRRRILRLVPWMIGALLAAGLPALIGLGPESWIAAAVLVLVSGVAWTGIAVEPGGPTPAERPAGRPGTRPDAAWLTWGLASRGRGVGTRGLERVRSFAAVRLARQGLDLDDPADAPELERLLGTASVRMLHGTGTRAPTIDTVEQCLDALDRVDAGVADRGRRGQRAT